MSCVGAWIVCCFILFVHSDRFVKSLCSHFAVKWVVFVHFHAMCGCHHMHAWSAIRRSTKQKKSNVFRRLKTMSMIHFAYGFALFLPISCLLFLVNDEKFNFLNLWTHWENDNAVKLTIIITWNTFISIYLSSWPLMKCNVCLSVCKLVCLFVCLARMRNELEFLMWFYCVSNVLPVCVCVSVCDACQTHSVHHI